MQKARMTTIGMFAFFPKTPSTDEGIALGSHLFRQGRKREEVHGWLPCSMLLKEEHP
jgi:hypothetical protein